METVKGYELLEDVLARAHAQASAGKGKERHACDAPFHEQPMQRLCEMYGVGFAMGQAAKKSQESLRLPTVDRQVAELLGAINYLAGAVIYLERQAQQVEPPVPVFDPHGALAEAVNADEALRDALVDAMPGGEAVREAVEPEWIEWAGGECPVPIGTPVDVRYRSGDVVCAVEAGAPGLGAGNAFWRDDGGSADITAYRVVRTNG